MKIMRKVGTKEILIDAAMQMVAEKGLSAFQLKDLASAAGVSNSLVFRHFETKEKLLLQCYQEVDNQIHDFFEDEETLTFTSKSEFEKYFHDLYLKFFSFLLSNEYKTVFYVTYRHSNYFHDVRKGEAPPLFDKLSDYFPEGEKNSYDYLSVMFDVVGVFATRIIHKDYPRDTESIEKIWKLLWSGLSSAITDIE